MLRGVKYFATGSGKRAQWKIIGSANRLSGNVHILQMINMQFLFTWEKLDYFSKNVGNIVKNESLSSKNPSF